MSVTALFRPLMLREILFWIRTADTTGRNTIGYALVVSFCGLTLLTNLLNQAYNVNSYKAALQIRTTLTAAIYRKALVLMPSARQNWDHGRIVNLMSVDAQNVYLATLGLNEVLMLPILLAGAIWIMYGLVGLASLAAMGVFLVLVPINGFCTYFLFAGFQKVLMRYKDKRMRRVCEMLSTIKILKMYAWEDVVERDISTVRTSELRYVTFRGVVRAVLGVVINCTSYISALLVYTVYVFMSDSRALHAEQIFVVLSIVLLLNPILGMMPFYLSNLATASVSIKRIIKFLQADEVNDEVPKRNQLQQIPRFLIEISKGNFSWVSRTKPVSSADRQGCLLNMNLIVEEGTLVIVVGKVGSGKSTLLCSILGDLHLLSGNVHLRGRVCYVSQTSWILNQTLRENILFGKPFKEEFYWTVIEACALRDDLENFPGRDLVEIGEKGINLSGGQKQRVSLARAVYSRADVVLLDDALSAVDPHVASHIFNHVIGPEGLLKGKTRLFVTHNLNLLQHADKVVVMDNLTINEEIRREEKEGFTNLMNRLNSTITDFNRTERVEPNSKRSSLEFSETSFTKVKGIVTDESKETDNLKRKLIDEEKHTLKAGKNAAILDYLLKAGFICIIVFLASLIINVVVLTLSNIMLQKWSDASRNYESNLSSKLKQVRESTNRSKNVTLKVDEVNNWHLSIYSCLVLSHSLLLLVCFLSIYLGGVNSSRKLHSDLLRAMLRAPISFFDRTPLGRISNRFSSDFVAIDLTATFLIRSATENLIAVVSTFILLCYSIPIITPLVIMFLITLLSVQSYYTRAIRPFKQFDSIHKSPIYSLFDCTLHGSSVIRAYGQQSRFLHEGHKLIDNSQRTWYPIFISLSWIKLILVIVSTLMLFIVGITAVSLRTTITVGSAGLAFTFSNEISLQLSRVIQNLSSLQVTLVAAERIREYTKTVSEAAHDSCFSIDKVWPPAGIVQFKDYSTRYRPGLDLVLNGISFTTEPMEKIGVVGRTGAGKSTLSLSLLRIIEPASGTIFIDGINIATIGLSDLRKVVTVIPQDPALFHRSVKYNLAPNIDADEDELWKVLEKVKLAKFIRSLPDKLNQDCGECGQVFSVGQRQLLCLARALIRRTRVLFLDEATASVDWETDKQIQRVIRDYFKDCTVFTIAHRIQTIMDYDRVMVMSSGSLAEFDTPSSLLADKSSMFYSIAQETFHSRKERN